MPKREGSYLVKINRSLITYGIADPAKSDEVFGTYYNSSIQTYELPVSKDSGTLAPLSIEGIGICDSKNYPYEDVAIISSAPLN
ncbi:hypothetical protein NPIL_313641 [Nephila pilipes]|uniref:Uncharacterized protein n=1 Tax=Nephila pilipes TaxID=299642 RepID=A0A8X6P7H0_NEPPI|nr:hypothetical protein NPIL_313641 [Nephila pilipes]